MKLTVNGVEYTRYAYDAGTASHWRHGAIAVGPVASSALDALADERHQSAEILEATTESLRHARTETNRWRRLATEARGIMRGPGAYSHNAAEDWCDRFDAESVDL